MVFINGTIDGNRHIVGRQTTKQNCCGYRHQQCGALRYDGRNVLDDLDVLVADRRESALFQHFLRQMIRSIEIVSAHYA